MSSPILSMTVVVLFALFPGRDFGAQEKAKPAPKEQPGLKVGEKAPRFTLKDQEGKERSLDEFLKKGKVALVFYRSADW
jgi:cytochrome oxidase Cu insertion factor (SCO1/SenC/PrrC family)